MKRIAIVGPESTGKSDLTQALAHHFGEPWVPEYAREYLEQLGRPYEKKDLLAIARGQLKSEAGQFKLAKRWLFCDTNLLVIKIWSEHAFGHTDVFIEKNLKKHQYDLHLLANIDLPWRPDPLREHPHLRQHFFKMYHQYLQTNKIPFQVVEGLGNDRLSNAISKIQEYFLE